MTATVIWADYEFGVYTLAAEWSDIGGVYLFTSLQGGVWTPLFAGSADNLRTHLANPPRLTEAVNAGAGYIHARVELLETDRARILRDICRVHDPLLNRRSM